MDSSLSDFEELLRHARPEPRGEFVSRLEASLVRSAGSPGRRRRGRRLVPVVAVGCATALCVLVLSIAGVLPLGLGAAPGAQADRHCETVTQLRVVRVPVMWTRADGSLQIRYRATREPVSVIRCR